MIVFGAMSGTSTDGVDVAALRVAPDGALHYLGLVSTPFSPHFQRELLALQQVPPSLANRADPLLDLLVARRDLTDVYSQACSQLMDLLGLAAADVAGFGVHGQTIRHRPDLGITFQMIDPARLSVSTGLTVVSDFRSKDVALGGQGAPLAPAFHQAWLAGRGVHGPAGVLNLGGFSNLTLIQGPDQPVLGGDCGPANCWMDAWALRTTGTPMDIDGVMAASGAVHPGLLAALLAHPFFRKGWPKSTGRDDFTLAVLDDALSHFPGLSDRAEDVMATLMALTVESVRQCVPPQVSDLYLCGGGVMNPVLVSAIEAACPMATVRRIEDLGLPTQAVEACAFAWMAARTLADQPSNCPTVTGAQQSAVLGLIQSPR